MLDVERLIDLLQLRPLAPEGGLFRQTWVSHVAIPPSLLGGREAKPAGTAIYYLLHHGPDGFSAMHRLPTDEIYHFYLGDPVEQLLLHGDGRAERIVLGHAIERGQCVQHVVPAAVWQGSRLARGGAFALLGTTMAPGFTPSDYEAGSRAVLTARYPAAAGLIRHLTR